MNRITSANNLTIVVRDTTASDTPFFEKLFFETRRSEFAMLGWDENQLVMFLKMQFNLQMQSYRMQYPNARIFAVEADNVKVGRYITANETNGIRLVDIAVLPDSQNFGIGSFVLKRLFDEAQDKNKIIILQVFKNNIAAKRLYERFGFKETDDSELYIEMQRHG